MCMAVPARIISIGAKEGISVPATVLLGNVEREIDLSLIPEAAVGDYVVTHSGYAISLVPKGRAVETITMLGLDESRPTSVSNPPTE